MPVVRQSDVVVHHVHGSTFRSYVSPSGLSGQICCWEVTVPPLLTGASHRPSRDEVLRVLEGDLTVTLDGESSTMGAGEVAFVAAGTEFRLDGGALGGRAWVSTTPGLVAEMADGGTIAPPWAN